jgi:hypothetical protein
MFFVIATHAIDAACGVTFSAAQHRNGNNGGGRKNIAHNNLSSKEN